MPVRILLTLFAIALALASSREAPAADVRSAFVPEPPLPGVLARLAGVWSEVLVTDDDCAAASRPHEFEVSPDGLRLTQRFHVPAMAGDDAVEVRRYRILYGDDDSLVVYREHETFEDAGTGDRLIRELVLHGSDGYRWRLVGKPREWRAAMGGRRCSVARPGGQS